MWGKDEFPRDLATDILIQPLSLGVALYELAAHAVAAAMTSHFADVQTPGKANEAPAAKVSLLIHLAPMADWLDFLEAFDTEDRLEPIPAGFRETMQRQPMLATLGGLFADADFGGNKVGELILDFRACPADIEPSVRWVLPPEAPAAKSGG